LLWQLYGLNDEDQIRMDVYLIQQMAERKAWIEDHPQTPTASLG